MTNGRIIAVWGSGGCGKTSTSIKLAAKLAKMNKDVIVVFTDIISPDINVIMPFEKDIRSMGNLWAMTNCNIEAIYNACVVTEYDNLCLLGYKTGENVFSYPDYTKENVVNVFLMLKSLADYVIVDCVSPFAYNVLSTVALEVADHVIRLGEATPKAFSFLNSNLPLLVDGRYKAEQHIKVLSKTKDFYAKDAAINFMGGISAELPYVEELEYQVLSGELFNTSNDKAWKGFNAGIDRIIQIIDGYQPVTNKVKKTKKIAKDVWVENMEVS